MLKKKFRNKMFVQLVAYVEFWCSLFLEDMMVIVDDDREMMIELRALGSTSQCVSD